MKSNRTKILFSSPLLERLTRTHISVPVSIFLLYAVALFLTAIFVLDIDYVSASMLFVAGLITFTWIEYQVHRRIFHLKHSSARRAKLQYTIHGIHHEFPEDQSRLAMPPVLSMAIATMLLFLLNWIAGKFSFAFLSGFFTGYALYLLVHYLIHAFKPPKNRFRVLWRHHFIHHYKDDTCAFGVSSPLWDYIYRTMPEKLS
jgi:sterol desaturase/sphingolipid hydroxylase (fatty acid hydroxylase superfamily)